MTEYIVRYIERGESPFQAAIKSAGKFGFTIVRTHCASVTICPTVV
jgi:hypothetical protein